MTRTTVDALTARRLHLSASWDREELEAAQMAALRVAVSEARKRSPWYGSALAQVVHGDLRTRADLAQVPFLTGADVAGHGGRMVCVPQGEIARIVTLQTSGSTGQPKRLSFTRRDLQGTMEFFYEGMRNLVTHADRVLALLPYALPDSTGDLLVRALTAEGVACAGHWPPADWQELADKIRREGFSCIVGLPQHVLALAEILPPGVLRSVLLCSEYVPRPLRERIERAGGCATFMHYGTTEIGLGGGVECGCHEGCHMRESDVLVEIVDPESGVPLQEGEQGEVVVTTLGRRAMPLFRYRTGDLARLLLKRCACGGLTARLVDIAGRRVACTLAGGGRLCSQDLDDRLFAVGGLLDYRATLRTQDGVDFLGVEFLTIKDGSGMEDALSRAMLAVPAVTTAVRTGGLRCGVPRRVAAFSPSHTFKRTICDQRTRNICMK